MNQMTIARGLDDTAVVLGDARVKHLFPERLELSQCARLVLTHEPAVADNIGRQDRR